MLQVQEVESYQIQQHWEDVDCNEEERELEEALSLSDLPINNGNVDDDGITKEEENENEGLGDNNLDFDFDFGSLAGSMRALDGEMCAADEVFSGGQILPYRNSVSSMTGLRSVSRSESIDRRGFGSGSSSSRSSRNSSIGSHYSATSSSSSSYCSSSNTGISAKTVPVVPKTKVLNQFHSYPSPKPQLLGSGMRPTTYTSPIGKKSKMWEVLKLGLVRTPEIELQDLKLRHRTSNIGKTLKFPQNNSTGSNSSSSGSNKVGNTNNERARKSYSNDGGKKSDFMLEMQNRRNIQLSQDKNGGGLFKSCKCSVGAIDPIPTRLNHDLQKNGYIGNNKLGNCQNRSPRKQVLNEDNNLAQKKQLQTLEEEQQQQQQQQQRRNKQVRQGKQVMSHHHRTFEWLRNHSHASVLNNL